MARGRSISTIDAEIRKVQADIIKTEEKHELLAARLLASQDEGQECRQNNFENQG
ncbi:MAG: hypothetical protein LUE27_11195 [Clostridia bacterium]|nr:hypothetical protein [Clostridia bacterium]